MSRRWQAAVGALAALLLGALAWTAFGRGPGATTARERARVDWQLPAGAPKELAKADAVWKQRLPWGAEPVAAAGDAEPQAQPWVPVGVVAQGRGFRAVFVMPGADEVRVKVGDRLPDGGRVTAVSRFRVGWTDAQGAPHEQELLADPLLSVPTGSGPKNRADGQPSPGAFSRR